MAPCLQPAEFKRRRDTLDYVGLTGSIGGNEQRRGIRPGLRDPLLAVPERHRKMGVAARVQPVAAEHANAWRAAGRGLHVQVGAVAELGLGYSAVSRNLGDKRAGERDKI